jgi:NAD(P)-dependent dehydrogenase (short-subunit alcohol dehydrogenase family)
MSAPESFNTTVEQAGALCRLDGKIALITGGESGIGQACAIAMARAGAVVVVTGRDEKGGSISARNAGLLKGRAAQEGSETVREIVEAGGKAEYAKLDVMLEADWVNVIEAIQKKFGRLDILVNNAGNNSGKSLEELPLDLVWYLVKLNTEGVFYGMTYAWPLLKKSKGVVLNMNSSAGQRGTAGGVAYPSSKAAQLGLTMAAAADGLKFGIRVISIHPGLTWTTGAARNRKVTEEEYVQRIKDQKSIPLGIPAYPADVAVTAVYLASDAARHITGIEFNIDGGVRAM